MEKCARESKLSTNQLEQFNRSSFILEISDIPRRKNEDDIELLKTVAGEADIIGFEQNQVGADHRTLGRETAPIMVKFVKRKIE